MLRRLSLVWIAAAQTRPINVTSVIHDYEANNAPIGSAVLLMQSDDHLNSACANDIDCATYRTSGKCPSNCLTSVVHPSGGSWQLLLNNQTTRTVRLTASFVSGTYVNFTSSHDSKVEAYAPCWSDSTETAGISLLQVGPGSSVSCTAGTGAPYTSARHPSRASLYKFTNGGLSFVGQYANTYRIDVTNP